MSSPPAARVAIVLGTASGGTAQHAGQLAAGIQAAGLPVLALGPAATRSSFQAAARRPVPYRDVEISDRPRPARDIATLGRLRRLLRRARPDIVHAHGVRAGAFAALALPISRRSPRPVFVLTIHNAPPSGRAARFVFGLLEAVAVRRADAVLCASADLARRMRQRHAAGVVEFDVPAAQTPPPAPAEITKARHDLGPSGRPVVLAVGRLAEQKGFDTLLAAATRWRDRQPAPALAIAGAGPLAAELAATAERNGVDLVLLGQRDDVPALLAAADVVAVPSRWEARALIVQEALRAGAPIVASRVGGIPDLTGADAAVLVPAGDPDALAAGILRVLDDPALAGRLAEAARARAASLPTPEDAVAAVLALYARLQAPTA
jgi:glycosyltransferase involved in cell wall biosynthesis